MDVIIHADGSTELMHYGVLGMKWGVRKASRQLSKSTTSADRDAAVAKLEKHRTKGTAKLQQLKKQRVKLDDNLHKATTRDQVKATKIENKANKLDNKAAKKEWSSNSMFRSDERREALKEEARMLRDKSKKLHAKASMYQNAYDTAKAKVEANESMQKAFKTQINNIDDILVKAGRQYING